jgi:predicted transcriptional regulator
LEGLATGRKRASEHKRGINGVLVYALGNWIRVDALAILAEGRHSVSEVAEIMDLDLKRVSGHIRELHRCGCIEEAGTEKVRNTTEHFYRAVELPYIDDETYRDLSLEARREILALIIQAMMAETLASFRAGKLENNENTWIGWDCANLDAQGQRELKDEITATLERVVDIKARAAHRLSESGEVGITTVYTFNAFERSRPGRPQGGYSLPEERD